MAVGGVVGFLSIAAFTLALVAGIPPGGEGREWLSPGVIGLVIGALTGSGMVWLWRQRALAE